jgi:hypothetical protein
MHRHMQTTNAIESLFSNVRQRTDQIDVLYFGDQLPGDCLGHDPGHPLAQNLCVRSVNTDTRSPANNHSEAWFRGLFLCAFSCEFSANRSSSFLLAWGFPSGGFLASVFRSVCSGIHSEQLILPVFLLRPFTRYSVWHPYLVQD